MGVAGAPLFGGGKSVAGEDDGFSDVTGSKMGYSKMNSEKAGPSGFDGMEKGFSKGGKGGKGAEEQDSELFAPPWNINEYHGDTVLPFNAQVRDGA